MKMMKILIKILITILIISFILWNRILRERLEINIDSIAFTNVYIVILSMLILSHSIILLSNLRVLLNLIDKESWISNLFINKLIKKCEEILNYPKDVVNILALKYPLLRNPLRIITSYFAVYINYPKIIVILLIYLPRIIVTFTFILDIFIFHNFNYFYKSLILLLIPVILKSFLYIVFFQTKNGKEFYEAHLNIQYAPGGVIINIKKEAPNIENALTYEQMKLKSEIIYDNWIICTRLLSYINSIEFQEKLFKPYVSLFVSGSFIIGWLYIFYSSFNIALLYPLLCIFDPIEPFSGLFI